MLRHGRIDNNASVWMLAVSGRGRGALAHDSRRAAIFHTGRFYHREKRTRCPFQRKRRHGCRLFRGPSLIAGLKHGLLEKCGLEAGAPDHRDPAPIQRTPKTRLLISTPKRKWISLSKIIAFTHPKKKTVLLTWGYCLYPSFLAVILTHSPWYVTSSTVNPAAFTASTTVSSLSSIIPEVI